MEKETEAVDAKKSESERDRLVREENAALADDRVVHNSPKGSGGSAWFSAKTY